MAYYLVLACLLIFPVFSVVNAGIEGIDKISGPGWGIYIQQYLIGLGWCIVASVGFAFGIGIAIKVFDWLSTDIEEWEEIKKGNIGVSLILIALIVSVAAIIIKVV